MPQKSLSMTMTLRQGLNQSPQDRDDEHSILFRMPVDVLPRMAHSDALHEIAGGIKRTKPLFLWQQLRQGGTWRF